MRDPTHAVPDRLLTWANCPVIREQDYNKRFNGGVDMLKILQHLETSYRPPVHY